MSRSSTITERRAKRRAPLGPVHPGEVLREEFLTPLGASAYALAQACKVPRTRIERLSREETPVTADTALRLGRALGTTAQFWMNLQVRYDLDVAEHASRNTLSTVEPLVKAS